MLKIIPFTPLYAPNFKDLNLEWIATHFFIEEKDKELLNNAQEVIIDKGGLIFMELWNNEPVSCFSLIKESEGIYELGKMAVSKQHQGKNIGQQLLKFTINYANKQGWSSLFLYSSTKLDTALHIYRKYGFIEIPLEKNTMYARSDIKMKLAL